MSNSITAQDHKPDQQICFEPKTIELWDLRKLCVENDYDQNTSKQELGTNQTQKGEEFTWFNCASKHNLHPREKPTKQDLLMILVIFTEQHKSFFFFFEKKLLLIQRR